jgi:hypothetical protein
MALTATQAQKPPALPEDVALKDVIIFSAKDRYIHQLGVASRWLGGGSSA